MEENWFTGSDIKVKVELVCEGFDMDLNEWSITVYINGKKAHTYPKRDCARDDEGGWYCCISRSHLKKNGVLTLAADASVPDDDFPDGVRHEVDKAKIGNYRAI